MSAAEVELHRHGPLRHAHSHAGPHRHLGRGWRRSTPGESLHTDHAHGEESHPHSHGLIDPSIRRSREGLRAVSRSLAVLGIAAAGQLVIFLATGSIALLADLIHNFGDAATAVPLGIAFLARSERAERWAGLAVVAAIFLSACVAGIEAMNRLVHAQTPDHLGALAAAGVVGYVGNWIAARVRLRAGRRLDSPALVADGHHARADAYVSLAVVASAAMVALGFPLGDPLIGLGITAVILRITWQSWSTVRGGHVHSYLSGGETRRPRRHRAPLPLRAKRVTTTERSTRTTTATTWRGESGCGDRATGAPRACSASAS